MVDWKTKFYGNTLQDKRWDGPQRHYYIYFSIKSLVLIVFAILIIVESRLYSKWTRQNRYTDSNGLFYLRNSIPCIIDAIFCFGAAACMATNRWHPIAALVTSILLPAPWLLGAMYNLLWPYGTEIYFENDDQWWALCWAEAGLQFVIVILYFVMAGYAAKAVHEWRKLRKGSARDSDVMSWGDASAKV